MNLSINDARSIMKMLRDVDFEKHPIALKLSIIVVDEMKEMAESVRTFEDNLIKQINSKITDDTKHNKGDS